MSPERSAQVFAALGDPVRMALVEALGAEGPLGGTRLREGSPITRQAVARHLAVLERAGLVSSERRGRERYWRIEPAPLAEARARLAQLSRRWDERLARLKASVEADDA